MEAIAKAILLGVFGVLVTSLVKDHISKSTQSIAIIKRTVGSDTNVKWESIYTKQ